MNITIERSIWPGHRETVVIGGVFGVVYVLGFLVWTRICEVLPGSMGNRLEDWIPEIILILALAITIGVQYLLDCKGKQTQTLRVDFTEDVVTLTQGNRTWNVSLGVIREVVKTMVITRNNDHKGYYKVVIRQKGHRAIVFATTAKEYEEQMDFEDTQLYQLYCGFRERGVKCC